MKRIYIDRYTGKIERTDLYLVRLTLKDGTVYENLEPRKLFPFTDPTRFITLLDGEERELGFVRDLEEIDDESRTALEACFADYYMIPKILKVISCEDRFGTLKWTVRTDRGTVSFDIRNRHSDIKHLWGTKRVIVRDSNDNRYEIADYTAMDSHSARILFSYL